MTILYVPLSLPAIVAEKFLYRELNHRDVKSVKVTDGCMVIEHERKTDVSFK